MWGAVRRCTYSLGALVQSARNISALTNTNSSGFISRYCIKPNSIQYGIRTNKRQAPGVGQCKISRYSDTMQQEKLQLQIDCVKYPFG